MSRVSARVHACARVYESLRTRVTDQESGIIPLLHEDSAITERCVGS